MAGRVHGGPARLHYSLMRFMVGDLELNLVAMVKEMLWQDARLECC